MTYHSYPQLCLVCSNPYPLWFNFRKRVHLRHRLRDLRNLRGEEVYILCWLGQGIWQCWIVAELCAPKTQQQVKDSSPPFLCSGQGLTTKNHPSPYDLGKIHECFPCLLVTRPDTHPPNFHCLSHKKLAKLFVHLHYPAPIIENKMLVNQMFRFSPSPKSLHFDPSSAWASI